MRRLRENNAKRAQLLKDQNKKSLNYDRTTFTLIVVLGVFLVNKFIFFLIFNLKKLVD